MMIMEALRKPRFDREPENVPGPFYVAKNQCITCLAPVENAPDLMGFYEDPTGKGSSHCFFKKQPTTPQEIELAIKSVRVACCGSLRYCGTDETIIAKIQSETNADAID
jgi:hypothetical protein